LNGSDNDFLINTLKIRILTQQGGISLFRGGRTGQSSDNAIMLMNTLGENNKHRQFAACQTMAARPEGQEILRLDRRVGLWGLGSARPEIYRNPEKQKTSY
jgi:hypothetical protein